jgi:sulfide:quinone oxidoreductase
MNSGEAEARALSAGLVFRSIPFAGPPGPEQVEATAKAIQELPGPILAYCRSGTRSVTAWAHAQAKLGAKSADEIIEAARGAGYDLSGQKAALSR